MQVAKNVAHAISAGARSPDMFSQDSSYFVGSSVCGKYVVKTQVQQEDKICETILHLWLECKYLIFRLYTAAGQLDRDEWY